MSAQESVSVSEVVRLSSPRLSRWIKLDRHDGFYAAAPLTEGGVELFDANGDWRETIATHVSSYPNVGVQWDGQTVVAFDGVNHQVTWVALNGSTTTRPDLPAAVSYRLLPSGTVAFAAHVRTPERIGYPWHTLDVDGVWRSHGDTGNTVLPVQGGWSLEWKIASSEDDDPLVHTHHRDRLQIDTWTESGRLITSISDDPTWMAPYDDLRRLLGPALHAVFVSDEFVYVIGHVLQEDWSDALPDEWWSAEYPDVETQRDVLDTVLEIRRRDGGTVVARGILDRVMRGFAAGGHPFSLEADERGHVTAVVWSINP